MSRSASLPPLFEEFPSVSTAEWEAKIREDLGAHATGERLQWDTGEGISLPAFLRSEDQSSVAHLDADPSRSPLASGESSPANSWRIRQDLFHPDPKEVNRMAHRTLDRGVSDLGLVLASRPRETFDGAFDTLEAIEAVVEGLPLSEIGVHLDRGVGAPLLLSALDEVLSPSDLTLTGSFGYDPVAALASGTVRHRNTAFHLAGELRAPPPPFSDARSLSVDLRIYHEAGASAVQELAFGLGSLSELLAHALEQNWDLRSLVSSLHLQTAVATTYFVELAKLRALRLLVPQVIDAYADAADTALDVAPADLFVQAETSRRTETIYDPYVNMLRGTTEAMVAVLGGCDVLSVRPYDASLRPPDAFGSRIARNVQLILQHEAHLDVVDDPGAGAYYIEAATDRLARQAWKQFQEIEARGGMIETLQNGWVQQQIREVQHERDRAVDDRDTVLVGTNHYPDLDERRREDLETPSAFESNGSPPPELDEISLDAVGAAMGAGHALPHIRSALGADSLPFQPLRSHRPASGIESVRLRTEAASHESGRRPVVFLAPLGPPGPRSARATFARNVFGVAGFEIVENLHFDEPEDVAAAAVEAGADLVVLCSADTEYPELVPAVRAALHDHNATPLLVVAGDPDQLEGDVPADDFIHRNIRLRQKLAAVQQQLGIGENE